MTFDQQLDAAIAHLRESDPRLAAIIDSSPRCTLRPHDQYYERLASSIIGQQLSVKAAATIRQRFADLGAGEFPTPDEVLSFNEEQLRGVGLSSAKVRYVRDLAEHVLDGRLDIARLPELPTEEVLVELTAIKGIGEWTAHMFLMFALGRLDVLPVGDLGVRKAMMMLYELPNLPSPEEMATIGRKHGWDGYESVASWYLWRLLDNEPTKT